MEFHFIRPYWLLALLPALLLFVTLLRQQLNRGNWAQVCDAELLPYILQDKPLQQSRWPLAAAALACLLAIVALAGPVWERIPSPVFRNDSALVIALDLSRSMNAIDIKPSRLIRARYKIADILKQRKDGQTALLVYAGDAFTVTPLTDDNETIASQLNALTTDIMPSQGSNTLAAVELAVDLLKQAGLQQGNILLVCDGIENNITDKMRSVLASYTLSILGVGTIEGAPVKVPGGFLKDARGNVVVPKLSTAKLAALAHAGHGSYKTISSNDRDIEELLSWLNEPVADEKNQRNNLMLDQWDEKGPWLLLLVIPLAALSFRKGLLSLALLVLLPFPQDSLALDWKDLWQTKNQQGQQAFNQKHYQQAVEQFDSTQWKAAAQYKAGQYQQAAETLKDVHDAVSYYNRGNALAKSGQLQQALEAYNKALAIDPGFEDAKYNKERVEKQLKKQQQQNQQQQGDNSQQSKDKQQQNQQGESSGQNSEDKQGKPSNQNRDNDNNQNQKQQKDSRQSEQPSTEDAEKQQPEKEEDTQKQEQTAQQAEQSERDENRQAREQWLKRIPDNPAGLLKRKFRYQYSQRKNKTRQQQPW